MNSESSFVLCVSGAPATGKTTFAAEVATLTGAHRVSFGDFVRRVGPSGASPDESRKALQVAGARLLDELGPEGFVLGALRSLKLSAHDRPIVWDGLRHRSVLRALAALYDDDITLVHLAPPESVRAERLRAQGIDLATAARWNRDSTELEVEKLGALATLVLQTADQRDGARSVVRAFGWRAD